MARFKASLGRSFGRRLEQWLDLKLGRKKASFGRSLGRNKSILFVNLIL
jgi:hypothetical protein